MTFTFLENLVIVWYPCGSLRKLLSEETMQYLRIVSPPGIECLRLPSLGLNLGFRRKPRWALIVSSVSSGFSEVFFIGVRIETSFFKCWFCGIPLLQELLSMIGCPVKKLTQICLNTCPFHLFVQILRHEIQLFENVKLLVLKIYFLFTLHLSFKVFEYCVHIDSANARSRVHIGRRKLRNLGLMCPH